MSDPDPISVSLLQPITADKITIGEFLAGLKRRWKAGAIAGIVTAVAYLGYYHLFLRGYQHTIYLQVEAIKPLGGRTGASLDSIRSLIQSVPSLPLLSGESAGDTTTLVQILNSDLVLRPLYEKFLEKNPDLDPSNYTYESFRQSIQIDGVSRSRLVNDISSSKVIQITVAANNKNKVRDVLDLIADELNQFNEAEKQDRVFQNLRYVNQEIQKTLNQIDDLEDQLNQFRSENQVLRPDTVGGFGSGGVVVGGAGGSDADTYRIQLSTLLQAKSENDTKLEFTRQSFESLSQQLQMSPTEALVASNLSSSQNYTKLVEKLTDTQEQLAEEMGRLQSNSPIVRSLQEQRRLLLAQLKREAAQIAQRSRVPNPETLIGYESTVSEGLIGKYVEAKVEMESLERMDAELSRQIDAVRSELERITRLANPYRKIEQRMAAAQQSLQLLLQTRQSLQLQIAQQDFTWRLLSDIDNTEQYTTTMPLLLALAVALILGGGTGVALALVLELLDARFLEVDQVRQNTRVPIVGQVPLASEFDQYSFNRLEAPLTLWGLQHHLAGATPTFKESFYFLLSHLEQLGLQRSLAITSAQAGEGRSTIAAYIALAAAAVGKRVLLVDANLRQPGLHQTLGIANTSGLAELLSGALPLPEWSSLLASHAERLWVLTAGQPQQEPMSLLSAAYWHTLLHTAQAAFDLVIVDTAPMGTFAETNRLLASVDQALFVVRLGKTKQEAFAKALKEYDLGLQDKVLGIVVNGTTTPRALGAEILPPLPIKTEALGMH
ncbi:polysaccharide biosynthesis tyrosine autokinase [Thermosynechococcaceae cyanobacterium Okahandja]